MSHDTMNRIVSPVGAVCLLLVLGSLVTLIDVGARLHMPWRIAAQVAMILAVVGWLLWLASLSGHGLQDTWPLLIGGVWLGLFPLLDYLALRGVPTPPDVAEAYGLLPWWDSFNAKAAGATLPLTAYPIRKCLVRGSGRAA